jgi:hypothetical protein
LHRRRAGTIIRDGEAPVEAAIAVEAVMEHLIFVCPTTGRQIDSGVESEIGTLLRIRNETVRVHCHACGQWHEWSVGDAFLAKAA